MQVHEHGLDLGYMVHMLSTFVYQERTCMHVGTLLILGNFNEASKHAWGWGKEINQRDRTDLYKNGH